MLTTIEKKPRAFTFTVGAVVIAEGMALTEGSYLVVFTEEKTVRKMSEDDMAQAIESGAKLEWS